MPRDPAEGKAGQALLDEMMRMEISQAGQHEITLEDTRREYKFQHPPSPRYFPRAMSFQSVFFFGEEEEERGVVVLDGWLGGGEVDIYLLFF